jgi:tRNA pseudouridine32 synthase / 23S rRNA pseudouridine746 synthase
MMCSKYLIRVLILSNLPSSLTLKTSAKLSTLIHPNQERASLVFETDSLNHCQIYLHRDLSSQKPLFTNGAKTNEEHIIKNTKKDEPANNNGVSNTRLVNEYEEQVKRMHSLKRATSSLSKHMLNVIYIDDSIVVVNKPSGVLCVPDINKNPSLLDLVWKDYWGGNRASVGPDDNSPSSMIVNRLDMDTSGLVIFGRSLDITRKLNQAFRERKVHKAYEAIVCGHVLFDSAFIDLPLQRDNEHPPFMRVPTPKSEEAMALLIEELKLNGYKKQGRKKPKESQTILRVIERFFHPDDSSLPITRIRLEPETGRTHQLRVHCAAIGYPILGDPAYGIHGCAAPNGGLRDITRTYIPNSVSPQSPSPKIEEELHFLHPPNLRPMCLHAASLGLKHPMTEEWVTWNAPVPFFESTSNPSIVTFD